MAQQQLAQALGVERSTVFRRRRRIREKLLPRIVSENGDLLTPRIRYDLQTFLQMLMDLEVLVVTADEQVRRATLHALTKREGGERLQWSLSETFQAFGEKARFNTAYSVYTYQATPYSEFVHIYLKLALEASGMMPFECDAETSAHILATTPSLDCDESVAPSPDADRSLVLLLCAAERPLRITSAPRLSSDTYKSRGVPLGDWCVFLEWGFSGESSRKPFDVLDLPSMKGVREALVASAKRHATYARLKRT